VAVEAAARLPVAAFVDRYEAMRTPVLLTGLADKWVAFHGNSSWTLGALARRFPETRLRLGTTGRRLTLGEYQQNIVIGTDADQPPVIFDPKFLDAVLGDFAVPEFFPSNPDQAAGPRGLDLLAHVPTLAVSLARTVTRPDFRWFIAGPRRSGTALHTDPDGTSAWNTVVTGHKLWVLIPPGSPRDMIMLAASSGGGGGDDDDDDAVTTTRERSNDEGDDDVTAMDMEHADDDDDDGAVTTTRERNSNKYSPTSWHQSTPESPMTVTEYFVHFIPHLRKTHPEIPIFEFIQGPGDTVFVPGGWWHAVLNLDTTLAVTQNFCSGNNFPDVWRSLRGGTKKQRGGVDRLPLRAAGWLDALRAEHPDLAAAADEINREEDGPESGLR
jgi:hypothetical protein